MKKEFKNITLCHTEPLTCHTERSEVYAHLCHTEQSEVSQRVVYEIFRYAQNDIHLVILSKAKYLKGQG